ncbi:ABC transporter ATP-binding protein [Pullulanibacillus sp. KACC 23026]|uniref:ABC transporter ATP-binding protein n=1 Tax=Pullulanibacillus sp. KACC 23026 TaxID=3028315 RepID=UPI0023AFE986|nr:ABC transporter ATP-binding protein [Pullulanibacillus sp. KACC 23026]WEG11838.1 ABC transporter ATP-binding protein [Pullulanibacillus sp. KACC 23026]
MDVLKAQSLTKIYRSKKSELTYKALDHVDLTISKAEFVGVMGPSGSGKTTLLNVLSTIDSPTSGVIEIIGVNIRSLKKKRLALFRRRQLGFIFQDFNLLDTLSIKENIILPLVLEKKPVQEMEEKVEDLASLLGIKEILNKRTYEVSGGQQQRAAAARALIHDPAILLADEPTGNLDSKAAKQLMDSLQDLNEQKGATIMMVTHDPFTASYCQRVVFIKDGKFYSEIRRGDNRQAFFQKIVDSLSVLGGSFQ